jgi:hypothetical protein
MVKKLKRLDVLFALAMIKVDGGFGGSSISE